MSSSDPTGSSVHTFKISFQLKDSSPLGNTHN